LLDGADEVFVARARAGHRRPTLRLPGGTLGEAPVLAAPWISVQAKGLEERALTCRSHLARDCQVPEP
jgi:hypothetical protein